MPGLLRGLSDEEQEHVRRRGVRRRITKGQILLRQGEPAEALYLVEAGRLKLTQLTADGQAVTVRFTGLGELCAAVAVLDGKAYPFSATAVESGEVRFWTRAVLRELFRQCPALERNVLEIVGMHSRELLDRFRELATEPVAQRLARCLLRLARLGDRGTRGQALLLDELAATTIYTVNRVLSEWEADRLVRRGRARITVLSEQRLTAIADPIDRGGPEAA